MPVKKASGDHVIFIVGPTAAGKTAVSLKLAKRINAEIISADSMQVYKGMEKLSQAPSATQRRKVRHHLVSILDPRREYNAASFRKKASVRIRSIIKRKKVPLIVGGSGLYVKGLIDGLFPSPPADLKFRKSMQDFAARFGKRRLHNRLVKIDPGSAARIHPNDIRRVIRALELYHSTGHTMTELKSRTRGIAGIYDIRIFGLMRPRDELYSRIDSRVDRMFAGGLIPEVKKLKKKKLSKTAKAALGLNEIAAYLDGKSDLAAAKESMKRNTRRFAKRQMTWFGADPRIRWFDLSRVSDVAIANAIFKDIRIRD